MFCGRCGFEIEERDAFCRNCGWPTSGEARDSARPCQRQTDTRMVAGVCSGVAAHYGKDVVVVRIIWTLAAILPPLFPGIAAYALGWLLIPPASTTETVRVAE